MYTCIFIMLTVEGKLNHKKWQSNELLPCCSPRTRHVSDWKLVWFPQEVSQWLVNCHWLPIPHASGTNVKNANCDLAHCIHKVPEWNRWEVFMWHKSDAQASKWNSLKHPMKWVVTRKIPLHKSSFLFLYARKNAQNFKAINLRK